MEDLDVVACEALVGVDLGTQQLNSLATPVRWGLVISSSVIWFKVISLSAGCVVDCLAIEALGVPALVESLEARDLHPTSG